MALPSSLGPRPLRVCYFGTYSPDHGRTQILLRGLRANGVAVRECNAPLWSGIQDRVGAASGGWISPLFWLRVARVYLKLLLKYARTPPYDVMLVGYPGQIDTILARVLTRLAGRPLALDLLMSIHLVAEERGLIRKHPLSGRIIFALERTGLRLADMVFCENDDYIAFLCSRYGLSPHRFQPMPHGVNDSVYAPASAPPSPADEFRVVYHGGFLKSHGVPVMVQAARELRDHRDIRFIFYGTGPERDAAMTQARDLGLENAAFPGFVDLEALLQGIAGADLMLGVFGTTRHALMTIQNKVWEAMGMGRPLVSGDSGTVRRFLSHRREIFLVERENPMALAKAILELKADATLRESLGRRALDHVRAENSIVPLGRQAREALVRCARGR